MTVTIELPPEVEAGIIARAKALGIPLPAYVRQLLLEQFPGATTLSPSERAALWRSEATRYPHTPPLENEAVSRETMYGDRG